MNVGSRIVPVRSKSPSANWSNSSYRHNYESTSPYRSNNPHYRSKSSTRCEYRTPSSNKYQTFQQCEYQSPLQSRTKTPRGYRSRSSELEVTYLSQRPVRESHCQYEKTRLACDQPPYLHPKKPNNHISCNCKNSQISFPQHSVTLSENIPTVSSHRNTSLPPLSQTCSNFQLSSHGSNFVPRCSQLRSPWERSYHRCFHTEAIPENLAQICNILQLSS